MGYYKRLKPEEAEKMGFKVKPNEKGRKTASYYIRGEKKKKAKDQKKPFVLSAWHDNGYMMDLDSYCKHYGLPRKEVKSWKLVSHTGTPFYNIEFRDNKEKELVETIDFEKIVKKYVKPIITISSKQRSNAAGFGSDFDRAVYTDVHIGMQPNENGFSLYGGVWNEYEILKRARRIVAHILENQDSEVLFLDDLGDFMDGYDGETTRKGHKLPQNMDNEKAFDVGLYFKTLVIDGLAPHYKKIVCHNICNDNHAGSFGYMVNKAFKEIAELKHKHVEVVNVRKFIDHYFAGNKCFIITHGKDSKSLKFGFKPVLDPKQIEKISDYIDDNGIDSNKYEIEFSKGDSHQFIFDDSTSDKFNYYNYPAASPSSEWVQTNFKKGISGFVTFNYRKNGTKRINPLLFKWKKGRKDIATDYLSA